MTTALIAIGSNLGDRSANIERSLSALTALPDIDLLRTSTVIETDPVGPAGQGPYLNAAAALETPLNPFELLECMLGVEHWLGRDRAREQRWGARTIDLDLLVHGETIVSNPNLTIPHPRLHERDFVLRPLAEIAPDTVIPGLNATPMQLLAALSSEASP